MLIWLSLIFIIIKLVGIVDWSWNVALIPTYILLACFMYIGLVEK